MPQGQNKTKEKNGHATEQNSLNENLSCHV